METDELKRRLRRDRDTLAIVGLGVMAFGVWSVIRAVLLFLARIPGLREETMNMEPLERNIAVIGAVAALLLSVWIDLRLRLYIGRSARAEGLRGEHKTGYLFAAGFLALACLVMLVVMAFFQFSSMEAVRNARESGEGTALSSIIVELTSLITLIDMIAASLRVKRMTRELEGRQG